LSVAAPVRWEWLEDDAAATTLRAEAKAGRLDPDCVSVVLAAAGRHEPRRRPWPAGLTGRQVEVLRLLARGLSNRKIAERLTVSPRTAEHHVQDVYGKVAVSTSAAAAISTLEHGLLVG
jgi:DNA-binding NarL/FixJ family response regulator